MVRHCLVCSYKRILSRPKTYETPCMKLELLMEENVLSTSSVVLHISMEDDSIYLDGNRWQRLILSHLPHL